MQRHSWVIAFAAGFAFLIAPAGHSWASNVVPVNAGFETGDFTGWQTIGAATIQTSAFGTGPLSGTYQALITTGSGAVSVADLNAFVGYAGDLATQAGVVEGSAIKQSINVSALSSPYQLSQTMNFLTDEVPSTPAGNDVWFLWNQFISGGTNVAETIGFFYVASSTFAASGSPFDWETGFKQWPGGLSNVTIDTVIVGFGVGDRGNASVDSGLLIDARVSAPTPPTLLLLASGLTALGTLAWRRRR